MKIKEVFVVEGRSDEQKLKSIFDCDVIITNGYHLSNKTLELIKKAHEEKGVILFLDPDYAGESIRKKINKFIPDCTNAYINKELAFNGKKYGVEHANKQDIINALKNKFKIEKNYIPTITLNDFFDLNLIGDKNKRIFLCKKLNISYSNNKTLLKRLNYLKITPDEIKKILRIYEDKNENS